MLLRSLLDQARSASADLTLRFSYLEIYNESIRDLMVPKSDSLMVVEDPGRGVFVPDLTDYPLHFPADVNALIMRGNTRR